jgi:hypothetical protein
MKYFFLSLIFLCLFSCGKNTSFLHHSNPKPREFFRNTFSLHEFDSGNKVDILWVVDNSGSMDGIQQNIVRNAELFMNEFMKSSYIDWKMGLVSTDKYENPYLGFDQPFNRSTPDPVSIFRNKVKSLGTNGDASEYVFHNVYRNLTNPGPFPFLRGGSHLAVIMVTDEEEQSQEISNLYEVNSFYAAMVNMISPYFKLRFYGAINAKELESCTSYGTSLRYTNSPFEKIIQLSDGFVVSACKPEFGEDLAKIGKDIASLVEYPRLLLSERPRVESIRVTYKGQVLEPGRPEQGGYWYYDDEFNMIIFYNLNFSGDFDTDAVDVTFEINDGEIRQ